MFLGLTQDTVVLGVSMSSERCYIPTRVMRLTSTGLIDFHCFLPLEEVKTVGGKMTPGVQRWSRKLLALITVIEPFFICILLKLIIAVNS